MQELLEFEKRIAALFAQWNLLVCLLRPLKHTNFNGYDILLKVTLDNDD